MTKLTDMSNRELVALIRSSQDHEEIMTAVDELVRRNKRLKKELKQLKDQKRRKNA